ncbi:MAG: hypothetical protein MOB07_00690 [Acidobacteria bacterium]|nr:hypothetical protein [Acidobacteriota bacterium]
MSRRSPYRAHFNSRAEREAKRARRAKKAKSSFCLFCPSCPFCFPLTASQNPSQGHSHRSNFLTEFARILKPLLAPGVLKRIPLSNKIQPISGESMKVRICLAAFCFLIFHCSAAYGQPPKKNDRSAEWEYKQLTNNPSDELLNLYAKEGWEIAAAAGGDYIKVILKRSKSHPLFRTQTSELPKPEPPPKKPTCKLTLAQAPVIRGLRLGITSDELFTIFPANERQEFDRAQQLKNAELPPNYGFTMFDFNLSNYATRDRFTGIGSLSFELFDKKVVSIRVNYSNAPSFDRPEQLMEIITRHFSLPELKDPSLSCDGFTFKVEAQNAYYGSFSIVLTDPTFKKIAEERKRADRAKNREGFKL